MGVMDGLGDGDHQAAAALGSAVKGDRASWRGGPEMSFMEK